MDAKLRKINSLGILGDVRQRLGADDENDETFDEEIISMSNTDIIGAYCGWQLGDKSWWHHMKNLFDKLEENN